MPNHAFGPTDRDRRMVESMSAYGIPQEDIAKVLGIDAKTLRKHFRDELDTAAAKATAKVAETLYRKATSEDITGPTVTAAIFWLKTRAGWKDTMTLEHTGKDGGPIEVTDARERLAGKLAGLAAARNSGEASS